MQDARVSMTETEDDDGWGVVTREREQVAVVQVVREDDLAVRARLLHDRLVLSAPEADVRGVPARVPLGEQPAAKGTRRVDVEKELHFPAGVSRGTTRSSIAHAA